MSINILNPVRRELTRVDRLIRDALASRYGELTPMNHHTTRKTGKKLRPAVTILFGRMVGMDDVKMLKLAACFELLHTSTLIHDDVIDNAGIRRGQETHNAVWDNTLAVLYGDYVFSSAMRLAVQLEHVPALYRISYITRSLVSGELLQNANAYRFPPDPDVYHEIIRLKTAVLFEGCCTIPVVVAGRKEWVPAAERIGTAIGTAFQLIDDCLDFVADQRLGKPRLIDLKEGKATLPVLLGLQADDPVIRELVQQAFETRDVGATEGAALVDRLRERGYLRQAVDEARRFVTQALTETETFPASRFRETFQSICRFIIEREF